MKIHWNKILKCFKYAAMDRDSNVMVTMQKPILKEFGNNLVNDIVKDWAYPREIEYEVLRDFRYLIEHDEYKLDGTENWEESLQERPNDYKKCDSCNNQFPLNQLHAYKLLSLCKKCFLSFTENKGD